MLYRGVSLRIHIRPKLHDQKLAALRINNKLAAVISVFNCISNVRGCHS